MLWCIWFLEPVDRCVEPMLKWRNPRRATNRVLLKNFFLKGLVTCLLLHVMKTIWAEPVKSVSTPIAVKTTVDSVDIRLTVLVEHLPNKLNKQISRKRRGPASENEPCHAHVWQTTCWYQIIARWEEGKFLIPSRCERWSSRAWSGWNSGSDSKLFSLPKIYFWKNNSWEREKTIDFFECTMLIVKNVRCIEYESREFEECKIKMVCRGHW